MIGSCLNDRYRLEAELGHGGMGVVYRARDIVLGRAVAVKVLSPSAVGTEGRARLLHEARAAAQLNHPNVVSVYDAGEAGGLSYIVIELVEGHSLQEWRPQGVDEILRIARQVCAALDHAHAHDIVHRDLKPENILLTPEGRVKLTDFGLARSVASRVTTEGTVVGTVFYLAPEQALGRAIDGRADLYALGVVLYEWVTGQLPFTADDALAVISQHLYTPPVPPSTYRAGIPPGLESLILQLLSKEPEARPPTAAAVMQTLDRLLAPAATMPEPAAPPARSPLDQLVRGRLVGRERELAQVRAAWRQATLLAPGASESRGRTGPESVGEGRDAGTVEEKVLVISGEAGVGKTPLVRELTALARVSGATVLAAECYADGGAPYAPVAEALRQALGDGRPAPDLPPLVLADLIALAPDLKARYPDVPANPPLDPHAERQRLFESAYSLCAALTAQAPLLLVVEDAHWADAGTLFLLRHVARRSRSTRLPLLITLTYNDEDLDAACCLSDVLLDLNRERLAAHLRLARYGREQTGQVLAAMFQEAMPAELVDEVYRETDGNLFFIEEVSRALVEEGKLVREDGHWQRAGRGPIHLPETVRATVLSRVARLPSDVQDVLRLAAIIGREFDFETLMRAGDWDEDRLVDLLETAERAQIVDEVRDGQEERFGFTHALVRTALRESMSRVRRHRLHRRVAATIASLRPDDYPALAYHHAQAGDNAQAIVNYTRAAERAATVFANEDAVRFYTEALALVPEEDLQGRFDLLAARARVYDLIARRPEQRADAEAMLALAEGLSDDARRCDALLVLADYYTGTEFSRAEEPAEQAAALARALGDPVREGHALRRVGWAAWQRHSVLESRRALEAAVQRFEEAGRLAEAAASLHTLSLVLGIQGLGDLQASQQAAERALTLSRQAGDRRQEAWSLRRVAIVYGDRQQFAQGLPYAEKALALHRALGDREAECHALNLLALALAFLGRPEEAERYFRQSLALAEEIDLRLGMQIVVENMVDLHYARQGEHEAGLAFVEQYIDRARALGDEVMAGMLLARRADVLAGLGRYAAALETMEGARGLAERMANPSLQIRALTFEGRMRAELGDLAGACEALKQARRLVEARPEPLPTELSQVLVQQAYAAWLEGGEAALRAGLAYADRALALLAPGVWKFDLGWAHHLAAKLHLALGNVEDALAHSGQAFALWAVYPVPREDIHLTHALALRAAGREDEARALLQGACERVMAVADRIQDEELRQSWLENVWANRRILEEAARAQGCRGV